MKAGKSLLTLHLLYAVVICAMLVGIYWGSKAVTVISENFQIDRHYQIVIDPGHGGEDGGATSCTGKLESIFNLEISKRLDDLFHLLGYETYMIRKTDTSVYTKGETIAQKKISDLKERVRIVNETKNGVLLSIHQNNFSDSRYSGAQVFYSDSGSSKDLANHLQSSLVQSLNPGSHRKSKLSKGVYLMEHIRCTGVLIECGFLSNPEEEAKLRDPEYQKKLCCVIAASVSQYLSNT